MPPERLPTGLRARLQIPAIAAPMLRVSGLDLVTAACRAGVIGAFPTANPRSSDELDHWLTTLGEVTSTTTAPYAANLIMRSPRFADDLELLVKHRAPIVITSVGSPAAAVQPLHAVGTTILADVATLRHARQAIDDGADGLVLLTAGSGGQTGWLNPLAFARAVRAHFDGPLVLAGGISDGSSLVALEALGCDLGYLGTAFLATAESRAEPAYKQMVVDSELDDVLVTRAFTGLPSSMLRPSIVNAGLDPAALDDSVDPARAAELFGAGTDGPQRWRDVWSAGHSVSGVRDVGTVADLVDRLATEYAAARAAMSG